jgi:hypothetical protein
MQGPPPVINRNTFLADFEECVKQEIHWRYRNQNPLGCREIISLSVRGFKSLSRIGFEWTLNPRKEEKR